MSDLYKQVISLRHRLNNVIDDPSHSSAQSLKKLVQRLEDEMQVNKNPKSLESTVKDVINSLKQAEHAGVISHSDINYLHKTFEEMQQELRRM